MCIRDSLYSLLKTTLSPLLLMMAAGSLNLRRPILDSLPTMDTASHCILCCLPQPCSANLEVFVLTNWTFFMCSDTRTSRGLPVSLKDCAPHSHESQYIMVFVSNVDTDLVWFYSASCLWYYGNERPFEHRISLEPSLLSTRFLGCTE